MRGIALIVFCAFVSCAAISCARSREASLPILPIGGDFTLTDQNGQRFELSSLRGKAAFVFFGYTSCPDFCPTTLSKLVAVSTKLGSDRARLKTLYITVDPQRDTPAVMKADLSQFDLDAIGLTGTRAEVDKVVNSFGAMYEIIPMPQSAMKYSVAHSTTVYLLDAQGRTRLTFAYDAGVDEIVSGVKNVLAAQ